ncbi:Putative ribonuclease H protein [Apostasia shenzhenica]|uniref:Ribonuclease H protein n=1 Tax=Apostasia shenzhenica TaxID=1088818 RepID=A0A2H9ZRS2_9ASPA|nr:Putative ribonuclease H protein [Apostasia shenzhenica]
MGNWDPNSLEGYCYPSTSHWDPPPPRWIKVNFDGSVKQNGAASAGGVVRDHQGNFLAAICSKLYTYATPTAEAMRALIAVTTAQEWATMADGIWIEGDSAITVADLQRAARGHPPDKTTAQIADLFGAFKADNISHIYRAANRVADCVASFSCLDDTEWRRGMSLPLNFCAILDEDRTFCT